MPFEFRQEDRPKGDALPLVKAAAWGEESRDASRLRISLLFIFNCLGQIYKMSRHECTDQTVQQEKAEPGRT